jgi:hypothetical protein
MNFSLYMDLFTEYFTISELFNIQYFNYITVCKRK